MVRTACALVAAYTNAPVEDRIAAYREALLRRAGSPMFRAALLRAMDAEVRARIGRAPEGLPWATIVQHADDLRAGEAAGTSFTTRFWSHNMIWCEAYVATYVARNGAVTFASQLASACITDPILLDALGWARRDGLISAADAETLASVNRQKQGRLSTT